MTNFPFLLKNVPFYKNRTGKSCYQVCMRIALKHFLGKRTTISQLDKLSGRRGKYGTWAYQILPVVHRMGLHLKYYAPTSPERFIDGESAIRKIYPKEAKAILAQTDVYEMVKGIRGMKKYHLHIKKLLTLREMEKHILQGHLVCPMLDWNILHQKKGPQVWHIVVMTGFDKEHFFYHESGPKYAKPHFKVTKKIFEKAYRATDPEVVIIFGKKKK